MPLVIVTAFLGHDLMMSSAVSAHHHGTDPHSPGVHVHPPSDGATTNPDHSQSTTPGRDQHPPDCGITHPALTPPLTLTLTLAPPLTAIGITTTATPLLTTAFVWPGGDPTQPPSVRRALLQVYRV